MRTCKVCGIAKPESDFGRVGRSRVLARQCHSCKAALRRQRYAEDPTIKAGYNARTQRRVRQNREAVWRYLSTHPCVDCAEADPIVLEFDHVYGDKLERIASLMGRAWEVIAAEIDKCVVRCCNCHRRKTAQQLGWYRYFGRDHEAEMREALAAIKDERLATAGMQQLPFQDDE